VQGFRQDQCIFRASALTFYSLLSIVPVLAMAFGIAKGFGFERTLEKLLLEKFQGQEEVTLRIMGFVRSFLETVKGDVIAGVGLLLLFWTIIRVVGNIEKAFNQIWHIKKQRPFSRKVSDYLSAMLICPFLLILSSALTVFIKSQIPVIADQIALVGKVTPVLFFAVHLLPYVITWILFTFVYMFMPNMRIRFVSGIFAGVVAGTLFHVFQVAYVSFQISVATYNAIYGSFAALPLFLIWLQLSWIIVLFGAEISFAHQNEQSSEFEPACFGVSYAFKKLLSLRMMHLLIKNFSPGVAPLTAAQLANRIDVPIRLGTAVLDDLVASRLVSEVCNETGETAFQPAHDIDAFTVKYVIDRLEHHGTEDIPVAQSNELTSLSEALKAFEKAIEASPANVKLKEI